MSHALEAIPLGGVGEFGMNATALRCGGEMILVDFGMTFPGSSLGADLGIDVVVPDITFLRENRDQLKALILTHGHEDHAGAVSFLINEIPVPVYCSRLTQGLVSERLKERNLLRSAELRAMEARQVFEVGCFRIEPLSVTHSFPDSFGLAIETPAGKVIWTGDFKFDLSPIDGKLTDIGRLAGNGEQGVLALFSDSTNSEVPGLCPSESSVYEPLRALFRRATKKIILSCFSSSIHRIHVAMDLASEFGRRVVLAGRSLIANVRTASELGYLEVPPGLMISPAEARQLEPERILILATGSQGEPLAALSRLAVDEMKDLEVSEGDMVILSARIIPGNEKLIANLVNHFYRRGARVYDSRQSRVHVSGHGFSEDLRLMINLVRPRYFIPIHGEFKQLQSHRWLAQEQGIPADNTLVIENGDVLRLSSRETGVVDRIAFGRRFIDEGHLEEVHDVVLRDRRYLSEDGFVVVVLRLDRFGGDLIGEPEIVSRGFVMMESSNELLSATRAEIVATVAECSVEEKRDEELFKEILRKRLKRFLRKQTGKRPMVLPLTVEI